MSPNRDPQAEAADPRVSAFVTANAGSGKTKTLIDRVARLLLAGARPAAILCVTYTKAAAAEMQRRLFARLGEWAVMADDPLKERLSKLAGLPPEQFDKQALSKARALFAQALETPGGLKIQTIHAFCEALLRRFPLEAGIAPGFTVMDDGEAASIARAARDAVALQAAGDGGGDLAQAYARMSVALHFEAFEAMFATFEGQRGALIDYLRGKDSAALTADVWRRCGFDAPSSVEAEGAALMAAIDRPLWRAAAEVLGGGGKTDQKCAGQLLAVAADPGAEVEAALRAMFTDGGKGTPATWVRKTSGLRAHEGLRADLLDQQALLEDGRERIAAARVAEDTVMALTLATAYVVSYAAEKAARGALDFADLIQRARGLLTERTDAAWVLFKLDGGIDHLLLDEAQDTAPEQWDIINALTAEFFAGAGASGVERTTFVVGDPKQSIYSFQGADIARFTAERVRFETLRAMGIDARDIPLTVSYRSTAEILDFVDAAFADPAAHAAVGQETVSHSAYRSNGPGCVDLWPLDIEAPGESRKAWDAPVDEAAQHNANRLLADRIAAEIASLVARGDQVGDHDNLGARPAGYGDVLILVRRRGVLFEEILRSLKRRGIPVAGADRLKLSAHIAFDDLLALARFCLFPDDDLTLAALLKSPFLGLTDDDGPASLYALAKPRGKTSLWAALNSRAAEQPLWSQALSFLDWARGQAAAGAPFDLFARALDRQDGAGFSMRQRFLTRLGAEAEEALAEFLNQAAAAEQRGLRDLESLTAALAGLDIVVKREMDQARGEVRVMTTHGAKGLEAPIVILPEIAFPGGGRGSPLLRSQDPHFGDGFLWCASKSGDCDASAAAREARSQAEAAESLRLLYVALTRARDRLILCGRLPATGKEETAKGWFQNIAAAFAQEGVAPKTRTAALGDIRFTRYGPDPAAAPPVLSGAPAPPAAIPPWTATAPGEESPIWRYAQPSRAAEAERGPAPSPLAQSGGLGRFRRGEIIHRLLQLLPDLAPDARRSAAGRMLASEPLNAAQAQEMIEAALGVLEDPAFAAVFAPGSRAEAAIAGTSPDLPEGLRISGRVDRLAVTPESVLVVDFKTNRPAPAQIGEADESYVLQMALYWSVLRRLFPGRLVQAALVWTDGPKLMLVPEELMARALHSLAARVDR